MLFETLVYCSLIYMGMSGWYLFKLNTKVNNIYEVIRYIERDVQDIKCKENFEFDKIYDATTSSLVKVSELLQSKSKLNDIFIEVSEIKKILNLLNNTQNNDEKSNELDSDNIQLNNKLDLNKIVEKLKELKS